MKKAMLFVSFGTSYEDARKNNIDKTINHISSKFKEYDVFQAYTSNIIRKKLNTQGIIIDSVDTALEKIQSLGYTKLVVVSLHLITGFEYEKIISSVSNFNFDDIKVTTALLNDDIDYKNVAKILDKIYADITEPIIFMGHGSEHKNDVSYENLQKELEKIKKEKYMIATVEGSLKLDDAIDKLEKQTVNNVYLTPLMLVCGDHAYNDMAGDDEDSFINVLKSKNINSIPILKGLGEYEQIGDYFAKKVEDIIGE